MNCWHRPGRQTRSGAVTCRHCGVGIEYCPCVNETWRKCNGACIACHGSMWVAIVRGRRAKFAEYLEARV